MTEFEKKLLLNGKRKRFGCPGVITNRLVKSAKRLIFVQLHIDFLCLLCQHNKYKMCCILFKN